MAETNAAAEQEVALLRTKLIQVETALSAKAVLLHDVQLQLEVGVFAIVIFKFVGLIVLSMLGECIWSLTLASRAGSHRATPVERRVRTFSVVCQNFGDFCVYARTGLKLVVTANGLPKPFNTWRSYFKARSVLMYVPSRPLKLAQLSRDRCLQALQLAQVQGVIGTQAQQLAASTTQAASQQHGTALANATRHKHVATLRLEGVVARWKHNSTWPVELSFMHSANAAVSPLQSLLVLYANGASRPQQRC